MGWQCHPAPVQEPRYVVIGAPRPQPGRPYYPLRWPVLCLGPFFASWSPGGQPYPFHTSCSFIFFFRLGMGSRPVTGGGGGGREDWGGGGWDFGASLEDDLLFLPTRRSFKPFLELNDISSSSSSELSSIFASTRLGVRHLRYCQTRPPGLICG